ncbi:hypothetical protein EXIGLDRAFT_703609 [Exidia glandulosa HHB12029]|uniref:Ubiquitin-like domain-containing protein n=1 Tax=Exidia glandulosa HHB12029 TaxID=1314781 RepID=A0A165PZL5_EXIGL|nr:hypothetical protein EXIGLDRAFT_703609 [Exidia glandulosa HHB12029]
MSSTITNATSVTLTMQSDISVTRSLVESMDARFSSVQDALSYQTARHSEATHVTSEIQATLRETIANEMAGVRADLSAQAHRALQQQSSSAEAAGIARQLAELQKQAAYLFCACLLFIAARMHRMYQSPVVVHVVIIVDLFGDEIQVPLHEAKSAQQLHIALQRKFQPGRLGFQLTRSRMYDLAITDDEAVLGSILPDSWMNLLRPGQKLIMNARILDTVNHDELACPACHARPSSPEEPTGQALTEKSSSRCPARFECSSRETVEQDIFTDPATNHSSGGVLRQNTSSQNAETHVPVPEPLSGTTIEQELALCKRIRILGLTVSITISSRAPSDVTQQPLPPLDRTASPVQVPVSTPHPDLNPLLRQHALNYNLLFMSSAAAVEHDTLTASQRNEPATNPSVFRMRIMPIPSRVRSPPPGFSRRLIEVMSSVSPVTPITLVDVLDTVHEWLHRPVEKDAWGRSTPEEQNIAGTAFWERVHSASPGEQESVRMQGLKRIDYLGDQRYFGGLTPLAPHQPEIWMLNFRSALG